MKPRPLSLALVVVCWGVFALALVWPTIALIAKSLAQGDAPSGGFVFSGRQLGLLWRSGWLAGLATLLCVAISLPGAYVVGQTRRLANRPVIAAGLMALLLCPPTVYAFGWERLLPAGFEPHLRCMGVWALWAWPIPAVLIGLGWSRVGRSAYEAGLLVASPWTAFLRIALPLMRRYVCLAGLILFVLYFGDYGVPHACGLMVYATELLGWAASSSRTIDTAWPALPSAIVTGLALVAVFATWRRCATDESEDAGAITPRSSSRLLLLVVIVGFAISWLLPIGALVAKLASPSVLVHAFTVYGEDLVWSLGTALVAGIVVMGMGLGLATTPRLMTVGLVWAVVFGALPGALIGESLVAGYNHRGLWWLYDYWPIVALCYVSRFGWIGVLTAMIVAARTRSVLVDQARTDGATTAGILLRIHIPMNWSILLGAVGVVAALSIADAATCALVRIPSFGPISLILIEKFHRFEDGMLISLSLWLVAAGLPAVVLLTLALRKSDSS